MKITARNFWPIFKMLYISIKKCFQNGITCEQRQINFPAGWENYTIIERMELFCQMLHDLDSDWHDLANFFDLNGYSFYRIVCGEIKSSRDPYFRIHAMLSCYRLHPKLAPSNLHEQIKSRLAEQAGAYEQLIKKLQDDLEKEKQWRAHYAKESQKRSDDFRAFKQKTAGQREKKLEQENKDLWWKNNYLKEELRDLRKNHKPLCFEGERLLGIDYDQVLQEHRAAEISAPL